MLWGDSVACKYHTAVKWWARINLGFYEFTVSLHCRGSSLGQMAIPTLRVHKGR